MQSAFANVVLRLMPIAAIATVSVLAFASETNSTLITLKTNHATLKIDGKGFITSLVARRSGKEYSPVGHPSPLLSLQENKKLLLPTAAKLTNKNLELSYPNGAKAVVSLAGKKSHFRFELLSLSPRGEVDNIVWGPLNTTISKRIGDIIGVVRDDQWAIGMLGLDDNTIAGPPLDGDCYGMGYYIHSPDPVKFPLPKEYKEGQWFNIGGDGVSDVAFYSHPEEYFNQVMGSGAKLEPSFGSTISYHARDRRKPYVHFFSLLPGFPASRPRHQVSDPVEVDFIGSKVALYACPDELGLDVIESIIKAEGLPYITVDGKWIRSPELFRTDIAWYGPHDKLIEYANALGLKSVKDEGMGEYYANPADHWQGKRVGFSDGRSLTFKEFTDQTNKYGIKYGLHTLCLFLQSGRCTDVTPAASKHLQTVLRTKLANDLSLTDTNVTVTDPSFLAEDGTWPMRDGSNTLRIGTELLTYTGISESSPYTLKGIKRAQFGTTAQEHKAGDELVKLQMNCYNGFVPDMEQMLDYADYYANVLAENGMQYIDFDGLESTLYQNHGYFGVRRFFRRLFDTYHKVSGGKYLRVTASCVFAGGWEFESICNVGGGNNMFDPILNRWGIEGKDIRNGFGNSYFPPTFGIQSYHSDWSVYDAENLQAKAIGFDVTYTLGLSHDAVENSGEKDAIFKAFRAWEDARVAGLFSKKVKAQLADLGLKFHLSQTGFRSYLLVPVKEFRLSAPTDAVTNPFGAQELQFSLRVFGSAAEAQLTLPDGTSLVCQKKLEDGQFIICRDGKAYVADRNRKKLDDLTLVGSPVLPKGNSKFGVQLMGASPHARYELTAWALGKGTKLGQ